MKKLRIFLYSIVLSIVCTIVLNTNYSNKIHNEYFQGMGNFLAFEKNQGLVLQKEAFNKGNNVLIYGSSELSGVGHPFHPRAFFRDEDRGFQVNIIGTGHCQSLIHAINFGAMGDQLKNQKVVVIISPQWFDAQGETEDGFQGNFSVLQFLQLMSNDKIDKSIKKQLATRVLELTENNKEFYDIDMYCRLYLKNSFVSNTILSGLSPYYKGKAYILSMKDKAKSIKVLESKKKVSLEVEEKPIERIDPLTEVNWEKVREDAGEYAKDKTDNNEFLIENDYYNKYIKNRIGDFKGVYYKDVSYAKSPEYKDLELLLEVCKSQGIKPLFVSVPVNGKWYDYGGSDKLDRQVCYKNIRDSISSYNYALADFSNYEYEDYFLKDTMHLGWKGWVYVDEAIDKYYHSN